MTSSPQILLLGDPRLYQLSSDVLQKEVHELGPVIDALHDALMKFRAQYGRGRAIAAPQIGVCKRIIYLHIDTPQVLINPCFIKKSEEQIELWDDCMSFPDLLVKVRRHASVQLQFKDLEWNDHIWNLSGDLSELIQHEYDHLDGILSVMRAIDVKSFALYSQKQHIEFKR